MARPPALAKKAGNKASAKAPAKLPTKARGKKPGKGAGGSLLRRAARWTGRLLLAVGFGAALGGAGVTGALYRAALEDVDSTLQGGPVWSSSGRVLSGPQQIWPGLAMSAEELAEDLVAAGYVRVPKVGRAGDLSVAEDAVMVHAPAARGQGWSVPEGEVLVTFQGGRISSISPKGRATFAPAELAQVRGSANENRRQVPLSDMPESLVHAVLAMEDARFYDHKGVDPFGVARALFVNVIAGGTRQGGSTVTQQLAKNMFLSQERTVARKAREAMLAVALENRLSKAQILELYLNGVYLGQADGASIYGVDQASRAFFGRPVDRLDLGEAATLGGIISAPNLYSPLQHPDKATERRDLALERMVSVGWLDRASADAEKKTALETDPRASGRRGPWAVDAAVQTVEAALGEGTVSARGLTLSTTLQPALQRLAERAVAEGTAELDKKYPSAAGAEMALIAVRVSDGAVVALVGGRSYAKSPYDRATAARRQVGSTVKPLTAVVAFEQDESLSPATRFDDSPIERMEDGKPWKPQNYDGVYQGPVTLREAIAESRNIPAVLLSERVGMDRLEENWKAMGLSTASSWKSSALGGFGATPEELAGAYTIFPGGGVVHRPMIVRSATDAAGGLLWNEEPVALRRASARAAFLSSSMLEEVLTTGTGASASSYGVKGAVAGKTGTTDDARDAWFAGYTRDLVVVVWVGFDKGRALGLSGAKAALPAWARFVAATGTTSGHFSPPADVEQATVCAESGQPARPACALTRTEWFSRGHVPNELCPDHAGPIHAVGAAASSVWDRIGDAMSKDPPKEAKDPEHRTGLQRLFGRKG